MTSNLSRVLDCISDGQWHIPYKIQNLLCERYQLLMSDASITARLRDLRKPQYGSHNIECRMREGYRSFEYRLVKESLV